MAKRKAASEPEPAAVTPAEYTVVARRYRPQQFHELIGQESVAQALTNALASNRVAHAYLFTGARGVGKTSAARILAKSLNCELGPTDKPCNTCAACTAIASGDDIDVLEIDGASNRRIEEVRDIRQNVQLAPTRSRYKIYIIDEVHMLTREAFNALLKTLEEPPPRVKFIFATTEVSKVPVTILSRCQRFDFSSIAAGRIAAHLKSIVERERLEADNAALDMLARRADGSMRDAESLLDQLLAFGERLTPALVHRLIGTAPAERVAGIAAAVLARDAALAVSRLDQALKEGTQIGELLDQLVEFWRDLMLCLACGPNAPETANPPELFKELASGTTIDVVMAGLDVLATTRARMKFSSFGRVLIELAVIRLARLDEFVSVGDLWSSTTGTTLPTTDAAPRQPTPSQRPVSPEKKNPHEPHQRALSADSLPSVWTEVLREVGPMLAGDLDKAKLPAIFTPNNLVIQFPHRYNRQYENCADSGRLQRIQNAVRRLSGESWVVRVELAASEVPANGSVSGTPVAAKLAANDPLLDQLRIGLGARLLKCDDGFGLTADEPKPVEDDVGPWDGIEEE